MGKKTVGHPLALPLLAALTPDRFEVRIIDEELEELPKGPLPDLVGITALISNIRRAYELADRFRSLHVPVVMGGPQVTFNIEEALAHADAVVEGEAEAVWEPLLGDFEQGEMRSIYRADELCAFKQSPVPRWDLLDTSKMLTFGVQISRGCPHRCDFCLVRKLFGKSQRYRDIDNVIEEIDALPADAQISFADDNLTADKRYARALMARLAPLKRSWSCQASLEVTEDTELLDLMAGAGCNSILIGFETLDPKSLKAARKPQNRVEKYQVGIENVHRAGMHVLGSFVVGFENDTEETFSRILAFTKQANLSFVMLNALSVYPGTDLHQRMKAAGRVTRINTDLCNGLVPTMRYAHLTQEAVFRGILTTLEEIFSFENLSVRGPAVLSNGAFLDRVTPKISAKVKLRSVLHLLFRYALSFNRHKRRLLFQLISMVRAGRLGMGAMMQYLMFVTSIRGYLRFNERRAPHILAELRENDADAAQAPSAIERISEASSSLSA